MVRSEQDVLRLMEDIHSKPMSCYPADVIPPMLSSLLDSETYDNDGIDFEEAMSINNGQFHMFNTDIIATKW